MSRLGETEFRRFLERTTGFVIPEDRWTFLAPRFLDRISARGFNQVGSYIRYLERDPLGRTELEEIFAILTVRKTSFFRNPASFEAFGREVLPTLSRNQPERLPISIWSAGCSTGEEPYSIAMVADAVLRPLGRRYYVLATDIVKEALATAREGTYSESSVASVPPDFRSYVDVQGGHARISDRIRGSVEFAEHNLVDEMLPRSAVGRWDVIFCRNVFIYFGLIQCREILQRFSQVLSPDGILFLGHAEVFTEMERDFEVVFWGDTFYYRKRVDPRVRPVRAPLAPVEKPARRAAEARPATPREGAETPTRSTARPGPDDATRRLTLDTATSARRRLSDTTRRGWGRDTPTRAFGRRGDTPRGLETRRIRRYSPEPALPHDLLAQAEHQLRTDDLDGAGRTLRAAITRAPRWAKPRVLLAEVYLEKGEIGYASSQLEEAIEVEPLDAKAHHMLGRIRAKAGDHTRAEVSLRRALYLEPDYAEARYALAQTYRALGQTGRACRELRNAIRTLRNPQRAAITRSVASPDPKLLIAKCEREIDELGGSLEDSGVFRRPLGDSDPGQ